MVRLACYLVIVRKAIIHAVTFAYVVILLCPIRYWPVGVGEGNTWLFALNYAAAHGLVIGRDTVFPMGPLSYFIFPQNLGNNLGRALAFQLVIWVLLVVIFLPLLQLAVLAHFERRL